MGKRIEEKYNCDKCGKKLPTFGNSISISTSMAEDSSYWQRLRVTIQNHHGSHNNGNTDEADLCQKCAVALLTDALKRVKGGERVSAGVETIGMLKFNQPF